MLPIFWKMKNLNFPFNILNEYNYDARRKLY